MSNPWNDAQSDRFIDVEIDGESVKYNPETGEVLYITSYRKGEAVTKAQVYRTGRGVVKIKVDGAAHRMMDAVYYARNGVWPRGYQGFPKNGDFSDLREENIILVRTREPLFGGGSDA